METREELITRVINYGKKPLEKTLMGESSTDSMNVSNFVELEKGCLLYIENQAEPMRFASFRLEQTRDSMHFKRFIPDYLRYIKSKNWFDRILLVFSLKLNYEMYRDYFHWFLTDTFWPSNKYSQPVRELFRVIPWEKERDIICSVLEHDTAYRYIVQDGLSNLNKDNLKKNPHKEIKRLIELVISRSLVDKEKFKNIYRILSIYLRINRKKFKEICRILEEIDLEEIKPSKEDTYWMYYCRIYDFFGLNQEEKMKRFYEIRNNYLKGYA